MTDRTYKIGLTTSVAVGLLLAMSAIALTQVISLDYSWVLFVATPLFHGFLAGFIYGRALETKSASGLVFYACKSTIVLCGVAGLTLLFVAAEGLGCLVMATPLIFVEVYVGALFAAGLHRTLSEPRKVGRWMATIAVIYAGTVAANPLLHDLETYDPITTTIEIAAPPEVVWRNVVSFRDLPKPKHWLFKTGIAYPLRARIVGEGVGAVRYCEFTTGPFIEPIEVWDAPNRLRFSVVSNPEPMKEASFWGEIHPPHLHGYMESRQGEFRLTPLPNGGTRLEGTTWYRHGLGPEWYWTLWSDYIIHTIHQRVLSHIKTLSESDMPTAMEDLR